MLANEVVGLGWQQHICLPTELQSRRQRLPCHHPRLTATALPASSYLRPACLLPFLHQSSFINSDAHEFGSAIDQGSEAKRFDPDGNYVRRWLPVLARLPAKYIHQPWLAPEAVLADAGGWSAMVKRVMALWGGGGAAVQGRPCLPA